MSVGRYNGIDYKNQRMCDVLTVDSKAYAYFTYIDDSPTGDNFSTLREMKKAIDNNEVWPLE